MGCKADDLGRISPDNQLSYLLNQPTMHWHVPPMSLRDYSK